MSARGLSDPKIVPLISLFHIASSNKFTDDSVWVIGAIAVTTIVPPLPASCVPSAIMSPYSTPGVMITLSAIMPCVSSMTCGQRVLHRRERVAGAELHRRSRA